MRYTALSLSLSLVISLAAALPVGAEPIEVRTPDRTEAVDFQKDVLPLLENNCVACHNEFEDKGGLVLETPEAILKGGRRGPSVVPGNPDESWLIKLAAHRVDPIMPPKDNDSSAENLKPDELGLIALWIKQGAQGKVDKSLQITDWQPLPPGVNPIFAASVSPDGQWAAAGRANQIFVYHLPTGQFVTRLTDPALLAGDVYGPVKRGVAHLDLVQSLAFSPDGRRLASGGFRTVKIWRRPEGAQLFAKPTGLANVQALAESPDGKLTAVGGEDGRIILIDSKTGDERGTLTLHSAAVTGLGFSSDGSKLVSSSLDKTIRLIDVAAKNQLGQLTVEHDPLSVTFAGSDGSYVAAGDVIKAISLWKIEQFTAESPEPPKTERVMNGHGGPIRVLVPVPGGNQLASGSDDGQVRLWDIGNGSNTRTMNHGGPVVDIAVRPDAKQIASASNNGTLKVWDATNGQQKAEFRGDVRRQSELVVAQQLAARFKQKLDAAKKSLEEAEKELPKQAEAVTKAKEAADKSNKEFESKQAELTKVTEPKTAAEAELTAAQAALAEAKTKRDATEGDDRKAADEEVKKAEERAKKADDEVKKLQKPFEDATKAFQTAEAEKQRTDRTLAEAERLHKAAEEAIPVAKTALEAAEAAHKAKEEAVVAAQEVEKATHVPMLSVAYSPDGRVILAVDESGLAHSYAANDTTPKAMDAWSATEGAPAGVVATTEPAGWIAVAKSGSASGWALWGDWTLERQIGTVGDPLTLMHRVLALDFSADGSLLATGSGEPSRSGELKIWRVDDGSLVRAFPDAHSDTIFSVAFDEDTQVIASGAADKFVKVHSLSDGKLVRSFEGHTHHVLGVAWDSGGTTLVSAGADNVIKVWDATTGEQRRTIQGFSGQVTGVRFVQGKDEIVSVSGDKNVRRHRPSNGSSVRSYGGASDYLNALGMTPDGSIVVAGGIGSVLRVWNGENGQQLFQFEAPVPEGDDVASRP